MDKESVSISQSLQSSLDSQVYTENQNGSEAFSVSGIGNRNTRFDGKSPT